MNGLSQNYEWFVTKSWMDYCKIMNGLSQKYEWDVIKLWVDYHKTMSGIRIGFVKKVIDDDATSLLQNHFILKDTTFLWRKWVLGIGHGLRAGWSGVMPILRESRCFGIIRMALLFSLHYTLGLYSILNKHLSPKLWFWTLKRKGSFLKVVLSTRCWFPCTSGSGDRTQSMSGRFVRINFSWNFCILKTIWFQA
jgi:hypothetical protein